MNETHTIAAALPTADDDGQAEFHGRAARPTAIKLVEDMLPRELFIRKLLDNLHFVRGVWAARWNGLLTDDEASRNPTLAAAWALAEANPSENLHAMLAAAQAAAAEAEEAA